MLTEEYIPISPTLSEMDMDKIEPGPPAAALTGRYTTVPSHNEDVHRGGESLAEAAAGRNASTRGAVGQASDLEVTVEPLSARPSFVQERPTEVNAVQAHDATPSTVNPAVRPRHVATGSLTRFRTAKKSEAFIAFMPNTYDATIELIKRECPSLASVPAADLSLSLGFDSDLKWVRGVLFRCLPDTWPHAVTDELKIVHVRKTSTGGIDQAHAPGSPLMPPPFVGLGVGRTLKPSTAGGAVCRRATPSAGRDGRDGTWSSVAGEGENGGNRRGWEAMRMGDDPARGEEAGWNGQLVDLRSATPAQAKAVLRDEATGAGRREGRDLTWQDLVESGATLRIAGGDAAPVRRTEPGASKPAPPEGDLSWQDLVDRGTTLAVGGDAPPSRPAADDDAAKELSWQDLVDRGALLGIH